MKKLERLLRLILVDDHAKHCQGREYTCECGYDVKVFDLAEAMLVELIEQKRSATKEVDGAPNSKPV